MIRLLKIEYRKIHRHKAFWLMMGLYSILLGVMIFGIPELIDYIAAKTDQASKLRIFKAVVFNFPDVWQNITYVASARFFIKIILGIIVIIMITNEFNYHTVRLNVVTGMGRGEFLTAKTLMVAVLTVFSTLFVFLSGLYLGLAHSSQTGFQAIFSKMGFLPAYLLEVFTYLLFCMFLGILLKKAGVAFIAHFIYFIIEPIAEYKLPDAAGPYLPLNAMNRLIQSPNTSLIKVKGPDFNFTFQEHIAAGDVLICAMYAALFFLLCLLVLKKRNL
ncbi:MAG: ABC transporter permease [Bacteroidales bacterium]|nr:ABC transporter permease [Bacteroidales bacterium]